MAKTSLLDVVDTAWRVDGDRQDWLESLVGASASALPAGVMGGAYHFRVARGEPLLTAWAGEPDLGAVPQRFHAESDPVEVLASYGLDIEGRCLTPDGQPVPMVDLSRDRFPGGNLPHPLADEYRGLGLDDALLFIVNDVGGEHFKLVLPLPARKSDPNPRRRHEKMRDHWRPVVAHIDRALRLRHALTTGEAHVAAELDAQGRGDFANPAQQAAIRRALEREQFYRRKLRADAPEESLSAWDELLDGRFSIVRVRERSGKLRFLAVENGPLDDRLRRLTPQERAIVEKVVAGESNKAIGIDLELHDASVAKALRRAMTKLGVRERVHLAQLARVMRRR